MKRKKSPPTKKGSGITPWMWAGIAVVVLLAGAAFVKWLLPPDPRASLPPEISVADAYTKRDAGAFILDIRQPEEWTQFHIPGSTLIPLGELESRVDEVPRDQEIVVVCRSDNRSQQGRDILLAAGFEKVTSMRGGVSQWQAAGYPNVTGP